MKPAASLEDLFLHPSFILIFLVILITIGNIMVGVSIFPKDKRKKGTQLHRYIYWLVVFTYCSFLIANHFLLENGILNYFVLAYLLIAVPYTRRVNETLHAVISCVGLVLFVLVVTFTLF